MTLQFLGAAQTVTGSMHLLSLNGQRVLLDCGLFQGHRGESIERNTHFPFDPDSLHAVVLSHAHIDHSGNLPGLAKQGFRGTIYATSATRDLCAIMLPDSAHIQEKDAEYLNKRNHSKNRSIRTTPNKLTPIERTGGEVGVPAVTPLYSAEDAALAVSLFQSVDYHAEFEVMNGVTATFYDAGHILGSCVTALTVRENGKVLRIGFTGDLGRPNLPILRDPEFVEDVDVLISESTYGGKRHDPPQEMKSKLEEVLKRAIDRGGKVIVPAFSVGRTQDLVYLLHQLWDEGRLPKIPIYVDSPLSVNATEVFRRHPECYDEETRHYLQTNQNPFGLSTMKYITSAEESKQLNELREPCMIIAASGMCEAGRILHHLANNIEDPKNLILIVSYQADHTLGKKLVDRWEKVKILGEEYALNAEVVVLNSFSAHADHDDLLQYIGRLNPKRLKEVFLVHGEKVRAEQLATGLKEKGIDHVVIPERGTKVELI
jgi:metallo-beta-lactamase family protein